MGLWSRYELGQRTWKIIIFVVVCLAGFDGIHTYLGFVGAGEEAAWHVVLYQVIVFWAAYIVLVPMVFLLIDRHQLDLRRKRSLFVHVAGALLFVYLHNLIVFAANFLANVPLHGSSDPELLPRIFRALRLNFALDFLTYWSIVGATYGIRYHAELQQRRLASAQQEANLTQARLRALEAQLNPHFFFNTLQGISVLALKGDQEGVVQTLSRLSDLIRICFNDNRPHQIPLAREMEVLDRYLAIQQLMLGDRLTVHRRIAPDTLGALVPSMVLQPLVENAIVHGVAMQRGAGTIVLEASREDGLLRITIRDSGPGFVPRQLIPHGTGLANTQARLEQLYGGAGRLEYGPAPEGGAEVTLRLPLRMAPDVFPRSAVPNEDFVRVGEGGAA